MADLEELKAKEAQIENLTQELHQTRLSLKIKEQEVKDLTLENEQIHSDIKTLEKKTTDETNKKITTLTNEYKAKIREIESELDESKHEIERLKEQLESDVQSHHNNTFSEQEQELKTCQRELSSLSQDYEEVLETRKAQDKQLAEYVEREANLTAQLEEEKQTSAHLREKCDTLKEEVVNLKEEIEQAQVHVQEARLELMRTNKVEVDPEDDGKRGNSLFSEVEDNRQAAMNALRKARSDVKTINQQLVKANLTIQNLKMENVKLHELWKEHETNGTVLQFTDNELKTQYESMIEDLKKDIAEMKRKLLEKAPTLAPDATSTWNWVASLRENNQKSENEMHTKIMDLKLKMLFNNQNMQVVERKEHITKACNVRLEGQIKALKLQIEQLTNGQPLQEVKVEAPKKEMPKRPVRPVRPLPSYLQNKPQVAKSVSFAPLANERPKSPLSTILAMIKAKETPTVKSENQENVRPKKTPATVNATHMPFTNKN